MIFGNTNERQPPHCSGGCRSYVDTRETFTLSGWAKGYSLPDHEREGEEASTFRLRAVIVYVNGEKEEYDAPFCPNINEWQFASVQFSKQQFLQIDSVQVYCEYNYNMGTAFFDCVQLVRAAEHRGRFSVLQDQSNVSVNLTHTNAPSCILHKSSKNGQ